MHQHNKYMQRILKNKKQTKKDITCLWQASYTIWRQLSPILKKTTGQKFYKRQESFSSWSIERVQKHKKYSQLNACYYLGLMTRSLLGGGRLSPPLQSVLSLDGLCPGHNSSKIQITVMPCANSNSNSSSIALINVLKLVLKFFVVGHLPVHLLQDQCLFSN